MMESNYVGVKLALAELYTLIVLMYNTRFECYDLPGGGMGTRKIGRMFGPGLSDRWERV